LLGIVSSLTLRQVPLLDLYSAYANNYQTALAKLSECRQSCKAFADFVELNLARVQLPKGIAGDLPSLLITPVQRVPRYLLLINVRRLHVRACLICRCQELLKHTPRDHNDYPQLLAAQLKITTVCVPVPPANSS
jgi:hypothetical protein